MKKSLLLILLLLLTTLGYACHESSTTLVSGPTDIGGGNYSTTVQVCIGQTVNWGGTLDFTMTVAGANFISYSPAGLTNTYNAYTTASCGGPNCFMGTCTSVTANATSSSTANTVTYATSSSTPAGYPLVPDDIETCGANTMSYCFNFTFVTDAYPASISLGGNTELTRVVICQSVCGHPATYTSPCNGSYDPSMTVTFGPIPITLLDFSGYNYENINILTWETSSEINNDYFILEHSKDGVRWEVLDTTRGAGNSNTHQSYSYKDNVYSKGVTYYKLSQRDFDGKETYLHTIVLGKAHIEKELIKVVNLLGQEVGKDSEGILLFIYRDGAVIKKKKSKKN